MLIVIFPRSGNRDPFSPSVYDYQLDRYCSKTERDAQNYLLSVAERYNIPEQKTEQTRSVLADYMWDLKETGYDED